MLSSCWVFRRRLRGPSGDCLSTNFRATCSDATFHRVRHKRPLATLRMLVDPRTCLNHDNIKARQKTHYVTNTTQKTRRKKHHAKQTTQKRLRNTHTHILRKCNLTTTKGQHYKQTLGKTLRKQTLRKTHYARKHGAKNTMQKSLNTKNTAQETQRKKHTSQTTRYAKHHDARNTTNKNTTQQTLRKQKHSLQKTHYAKHTS